MPSPACQYVITSADGTQTRRLPRKCLQPANWNVQRLGGYADLTLPTTLPFAAATPRADAVRIGDRVEVWFQGLRRYRGYVTGLLPSRTEPRTLTVQAYGLAQQMGKLPVDRRFAFAGGGVDVATAFQELMRTVALAPGGSPTLTSVSSAPIGTTLSALDGEGKALGDVINDLVAAAGNLAAWGVGVGPDGLDQAFVAPIDLTGIDYVLPVPARQTGTAASELQTADVVNVLKITGGNPKFPNLLHNGSFELPVTQQDQAGNWIVNGSFEDGAVGVDNNVDQWTANGGASIQGNDIQDTNVGTAYDGNNFAQMDHNGESVEQDRSGLGLTAGDPYLFSFYAASQRNTGGATGRVEFYVKDGGGNVLTSQIFTVTNPSPYYDYFEFPFVMPAGASAYKVYAASTGSGGFLLDAVNLYDTADVYQEGWTTISNGNGRVTAINWVHSGTAGVDSFDGAYSVLVGLTTSQSAGNGVDLLPPRYAPISVSKTKNYVLSCRAMSLGTTPVNVSMSYDWWGDNGNSSFGQQDGPGTSCPVGQWTYIQFLTQNQQGDAVNSLLPIVRLNSGGTVLIDAVMVQDAGVLDSPQYTSGPGGSNPYVDDGPLTYVIRADDARLDQFHGGAAPPYAGSIAAYGPRFAAQTVDSVLDVPGALQVADALFQSQALAYYRPTIERLNDPTVYQPGKTFRLDGADGPGLCAAPVQIARVRERDDGVLHTTLEGEREQPDLQVTVRAMILKALAANGPGAGSGSGGGSGYSNGSNLNPTGVPSQPPGTKVALNSADTAPGFLDDKTGAAAPLTLTDVAGVRTWSLPAATDAQAGHLTATDHLSLTAAVATTSEVTAARTPATGSAYASLKARLDAMAAAAGMAAVGALTYQGAWNAGTNTPALASGTGTLGYYYKVGTAGSTTIDGNSAWHVGDWIVFDGTAWDKIDNYEAVTSVAGRVGAITLSASDISGLGTAATQNSSAFDAAGAAATAQANAIAASDPAGSASAAQSASLQKSNNLSDVASASTARTNLGLGTAATQAVGAFDAAGAAASAQAAAQASSLQKGNNLSDLANAATARTNLGLGTAATHAATDFLTPAAPVAPDSISVQQNSAASPNLLTAYALNAATVPPATEGDSWEWQTSTNAGSTWSSSTYAGDAFPYSLASGTVRFRARLNGQNGTTTGWVSSADVTYSAPATGGGGGSGSSGSSIILDYTAASDIFSGTSLSATTWTNVGSSQSFTVSGTGAVVAVSARAGMNLSGNGSAVNAGARLLIDGTTAKMLGGNATSTTGQYTNPFAGNGTVYLTGLSAGSHTVQAQVYAQQSGITAYLRASTQSATEFLAIQVVQQGGTAASLLLDANVSTGSDIFNGAAISATTWTNVGSSQSFTVSGTGAVVAVSARAGMNLSGNGSAVNAGARLLIDGTTAKMLGGSTTSASGQYTNPFAGNGTVYLTGLSAGSHTVQAQVYAQQSGVTAYLRSSSFPSLEFLSFQVLSQ